MADSAFKDTPIPDWYNGNLDLNQREIYRHPDGYIQTEHSIGSNFDGNDDYRVRLPQIIGGKPVGWQAAEKNFFDTGEHLGVDFRRQNETPSAFHQRVDGKDIALHERQAKYYGQEMKDWNDQVNQAKSSFAK